RLRRPIDFSGHDHLLHFTTDSLGRTESGARTADYWTRRHEAGDLAADRYWTEARTTVFGGALALLEAGGGKGRILDVGGGVGHFAGMALAAGWDAYSLDVSELAVAAAAQRIGAARSLSTISEDLAGTFDAVTLWCVIAHVPDPRAVLADAVRALRPGGQLFLTTPNFRFQIGYAAALARLRRPIDFSGHDHLLHFTTDSLGRTLEAVGLSSWQLQFVGVTEECVAEPRLARWVVPAKRAWNRTAGHAARAHLPYLGSELQVVGSVP
ncbi:MAG TPA: class I SAM-dependent methyltransferase, partial [Cryptosporangiaceae bacterium]|nr:class I SAM-dependent methyltransferase [Cryptosporangiaceae bacterium]